MCVSDENGCLVKSFTGRIGTADHPKNYTPSEV